MLCLSDSGPRGARLAEALALVFVAAASFGCGATPPEPKTELAPYVHPFVSARLTVRVVDVEPSTEPPPAVPTDEGLDGERANVPDPVAEREATIAAALGGIRRPTLDCFAPGQPAADVWIVGRAGNGGHVRALEVASSSAGKDATRCLAALLWRAVLPERGIAFSYRLHVEPWKEGCTTKDCEALPDPIVPPPSRPKYSGAAATYSPALWLARIRRCYNRSLATNPDLSGGLSVHAMIGRDGLVMRADSESSSLSDPALASCIVGVIQSVKFPVPEDGPVEVVFPFTFTGSPSPEPRRDTARRDAFQWDVATAADIVHAAESKGMRGAVVPGELDEPGQPFVVFLEENGHVAALRRVHGEPRPEATRRSMRVGDSTIVLDDPELAHGPAFFVDLQR